MGVITIAVAAYIGLAAGMIAAVIGILSRYLLQNASWSFRAVLCVPLAVSVATSGGMAMIALLGENAVVFGLDVRLMLVTNVLSQGCFVWMYVIYGVYCHFRSSRCPM